MTAIDYAALVDRARKSIIKDIPSSRVDILLGELADALERLTQPVGVEPAGIFIRSPLEVWLEVSTERDNSVYLYHGEEVARLIAERDAARYELDEAKALAKFLYQRSDEKGTAIAALQEQVKGLRELVRNSTEYRLGVPAYELAATEPKEPDNPSDKQWEHAKFVQRVLEAGNEATAEDRAEAYWMVKEFRNMAHAAATPPSDDAMLFEAEAKRSRP